MDNREIRAAADRAEWQIILGVTAAFGLAAWRLFAASILALGDPPSYRVAAGTVVEAGLCAFLALRLRTGRVVAAATLLAIWALGFGYAWLASDSVVPPFFLISILIGVGLFQGLVGSLAQRDARTPLDPAA